MPHPVVHFEIACKDGEAGQKFYADLFGWKISADNPMKYGIVEKGGENGIGGGITGIFEGSDHPGVTFYIEADDLQACLDRAESLGGKTVMPVTEIPGFVTLAHFADPDGNVIGLVKSMG